MGLFRRKKTYSWDVKRVINPNGGYVEYHSIDARAFVDEPAPKKSYFQKRKELSKIKTWYKDGMEHVAAKEYGKAKECFSNALELDSDIANSWYKKGNMFSLLKNIVMQIEDKEYAWLGDGKLREYASTSPTPLTTRHLDDMQRKWLELPHTTSLETLEDCIRVLRYLERGKNDPYRISTENS